MTGGREEAILGRLMLAFRGRTLPAWLRARLAAAPATGVTLFRHHNVESPAQLRELTGALQAAAPGDLPLLVAADQEGGQLLALGDPATPFAGAMAIGATGDDALAEQVGRAIGRELRAVGVNVDYAPVLDLGSSPANASLGVRTFGDDPEAVARLGAAFVRGLQSAGVAATAKHFPGTGLATIDPHHGLPVIERGLRDLEASELVPFRAAIRAGARLVMSGHVAVPDLTGADVLPATLSAAILGDLLRRRLGFRGVAISDALDMAALAQGEAQVVDVIAAVRAGIDLLLATPDRVAQRRIEAALRQAAARGLVGPAAIARSAGRIAWLRRWVARTPAPGLDVVGGAEHLALARQLAARSITLVRDEARLLPIRLPAGVPIAAIMPEPRDLTPADTSATVRPVLAAALRAHHPRVDEFVTGHPPSSAEIASLRARAGDYGLIVVGTINAAPGSPQAALVEALLGAGPPVVTVALRVPSDLAAYPRAQVNVATYSILVPSLEALAAALFGAQPFTGRLPVPIPGLHPRGHGLVA